VSAETEWMGIGFIGGMEWRRDAAAVPGMFRDATIFTSLGAVFSFSVEKAEKQVAEKAEKSVMFFFSRKRKV
jgi:hypothetical protein